MREIAACVPVDQYVEICLLNLDCPLQSKPSPWGHCPPNFAQRWNGGELPNGCRGLLRIYNHTTVSSVALWKLCHIALGVFHFQGWAAICSLQHEARVELQLLGLTLAIFNFHRLGVLCLILAGGVVPLPDMAAVFGSDSDSDSQKTLQLGETDWSQNDHTKQWTSKTKFVPSQIYQLIMLSDPAQYGKRDTLLTVIVGA